MTSQAESILLDRDQAVSFDHIIYSEPLHITPCSVQYPALRMLTLFSCQTHQQTARAQNPGPARWRRQAFPLDGISGRPHAIKKIFPLLTSPRPAFHLAAVPAPCRKSRTQLIGPWISVPLKRFAYYCFLLLLFFMALKVNISQI